MLNDQDDYLCFVQIAVALDVIQYAPTGTSRSLPREFRL